MTETEQALRRLLEQFDSQKPAPPTSLELSSSWAVLEGKMRRYLNGYLEDPTSKLRTEAMVKKTSQAVVGIFELIEAEISRSPTPLITTTEVGGEPREFRFSEVVISVSV